MEKKLEENSDDILENKKTSNFSKIGEKIKDISSNIGEKMQKSNLGSKIYDGTKKVINEMKNMKNYVKEKSQPVTYEIKKFGNNVSNKIKKEYNNIKNKINKKNFENNEEENNYPENDFFNIR